MPSSFHFYSVLAIFSLTYLGLAIGDLPKLRADRSWIALGGGALILLTGSLSLSEAARGIDFKTILLLFGMMVVVGSLRAAGFFDVLVSALARTVRSPFRLLALVVFSSGLLSAILVNDVVCVALTPVVIRIVRRLKLPPLPFLVALATAANTGSTATVVGNPQNMIIGGLSGITYARFTERLAPVALIALVLNLLILAFVYRKELSRASGVLAPPEDAAPGSWDAFRVAQGLGVVLLAIALFFAGLPQYAVALGAAAAMLIRRPFPRELIRDVDWKLLVLFVGLFVVIHALEVVVVDGMRLETLGFLTRHPISALSLVSAALSNIVSNVPAVLLFKPVMATLSRGARETAWLALAMSSTLAGNLTILGSVANLIVVEGAKREGITVSFRDYFRAGVAVTGITLACGIAWLHLAGH